MIPSGGHPVLLHGLEQGGLGLGRGAVDLVGQEDVGEDRALQKAEGTPLAARLFLQDIRAGDVRGHEVRGELDAVELELHDPGQGGDEQRLGQAGHAHQEAVAAAEEGDQDLFDHLLLADDHLVDLLHDLGFLVAHLLDLRKVMIGYLVLCRGFHALPHRTSLRKISLSRSAVSESPIFSAATARFWCTSGLKGLIWMDSSRASRAEEKS